MLLNGNYIDIGIGKDALCIDAEEDMFVFKLLWEDDAVLSLEFDYERSSNLQPLKRVIPDDFQYLAAEQIGPKSVFPVSDYDINILKSLGKNGQYTAHFLFEKGARPLAIKELMYEKAKSDSDHFLNGVRIAAKKDIIEPENISIFYYSREDNIKGYDEGTNLCQVSDRFLFRSG